MQVSACTIILFTILQNSVCKTLINRAKTICEVSKIGWELEHFRSVLKMNDYPTKFIDNAMKTPRSVSEKIISNNLGIKIDHNE